MARRKQRRPQHLENPEELAISLQNGIASSSDTEDDEHVCGKCRAEFPSLSDFLQHKKSCVSKRPVLLAPLDSSLDTDEEDDPDDSDDRVSPPALYKSSRSVLNRDWYWTPNLRDVNNFLFCNRPDTNVTLEELKTTTVAVAQHSHLLNELTFRDFFSKFHQRQVESLHLIKTIENILNQNPVPNVIPPLIGTIALTPPQSADGAPVVTSSAAPSSSIVAIYPQNGGTQEDSPGPPLPPPETNNLALLEKQTERYLQDSMARRSFLLNGIEDDNRSKKKLEQDPALRHRCQFCGKLLGSDSALQIHLRSHTGEKPFRCAVCNSAFSTKGNLKVHYQRHKERREVGEDQKSLDDRSSMAVDGRPENPPVLFPNDTGNGCESSKGDQALDFSTTVNGRRSPSGENNSRCSTPNDMSNLSDNSEGSSDENMTAENFRELKIDVERFDDEDRDNSNCMDDDESEVNNSQASFGTSPTFAPYFLPSSYDNFAPSTSTAGTSNNASGNNDGSETVLQDPNYIQDLLPRIGSNDNSWESLIEVTKTSETSKLQQLVDNIEHKLIEPNQCIICHRVLSCKSALQMHYRTHTGERPFKCKLCNRAFTTKGNLKTHMGVHRTKPTARLLHQCPVCHKPFQNSLLLQQHIRSHTENSTVQIGPIFSCEERPPTLLPPSYPRQFLIPPQIISSEPLALTSAKSQDQTRNLAINESVIKPTGVDNNNSTQAQCVSPSLSAASSSSPTPDENQGSKELNPPLLDLAQTEQEESVKDDMHQGSPASKISESNSVPEKGRLSGRSTPMDTKPDFESNLKPEVTPSNHNQIQSPNSIVGGDVNERSPLNASIKSPPKFSSQPENALVVSLASDRPLPMTLPSDCPIPFSIHGSDRPYPTMSMANCTTDFTTASLTALENHVKGIASNVTHPLPFAPHFGMGLNVSGYYRDFGYHQKSSTSSPSTSKNGSDASTDDRSTPGGVIGNKSESPRAAPVNNQSLQKHENTNGIGALDLTPRNSPAFQRPAVSDMKIFAPLAGLPFHAPHHRLGTTCRVCFKTFACQSALEIHYRSHTKERPFRCDVCDRGFSTKGNMRQHMLTHKIREFPPQVFNNSSNLNISSSNSTTSTNTPQKVETSGDKSPKKTPEETMKRLPTEGSLPLPQPKRAPGQPKHLCQVCNKPFSSGSALQIHMRTHTGDKPFQCHICHRAFTTKGNLKVHMGTHMWNNSTSRRGRRMSLDLGPLQIPPGGKPGEFPQPPYFPYLPSFLNGLAPPQPPPKMNEISVIQTAGVSGGGGCTAPPTTSSIPATSQQPLPLISSASKQRDRDESNLHQNSNQLPQGKDSHQVMQPSSEIAASWQWKISCNMCNKICSSSTELELHLRNNHCKKDSPEANPGPSRTDSVP